MDNLKSKLNSTYALSELANFFFMRKAAVPPIKVPIMVKGSGTDSAVLDIGKLFNDD